jgi:uncharacterized protein
MWRERKEAATEEVMKAVLALLLLYVGTFLVVIQSASQGQVQAAPQNAASAQDPTEKGQAKSIDPAKESDIRALMELVGVRDQVQDGVSASAEQYREKLLATVPDNEKGQAFVNAFVASYEKKFDPDQVTEKVVNIYDKHYSDEEIKGLLQFFGSPLGQKVAAEMPKIAREVAAASREVGAKASREALQALKAQNPEIGQSARLGNGQRRWQQRGQGQNQAPGQTQSQPQQADSSQP